MPLSARVILSTPAIQARIRDRMGQWDHPDAVLETAPYGINNRGQIVGDYEDARGGCHGYLLDNGRFTTIDVPGEPTQALGLNDRGQVVGLYERVAGQAVEAREGASRSGSGPTRGEDIGSAPSPLTSWWTESGAASIR
jgi:hypothetical protein